MPYGLHRRNENFLGGGSTNVTSSLPSTNVGNSRSRGAARPGTPALSAQTISTYTNTQPRGSSKRSSANNSSSAGSKSRRSVRGDPYASGSNRLRNRKLGNRKLRNSNGAPSIPNVLGNTSYVNKKKKLKSEITKNISNNISNNQSKKKTKRRRKSRQKNLRRKNTRNKDQVKHSVVENKIYQT